MNSILSANGLEINKLREIDGFHPGFLRCVLNIAAKSVVGVAYEGSDIAERAIRYMEMRGKRIQKEIITRLL